MTGVTWSVALAVGIVMFFGSPAVCQLISSWEDPAAIGPDAWHVEGALNGVVINLDSSTGLTDGIQSMSVELDGSFTQGDGTHFDRPIRRTFGAADPEFATFTTVSQNLFNFNLEFDVTFDPNLIAGFPPEASPFVSIGVAFNSEGGV